MTTGWLLQSLHIQEGNIWLDFLILFALHDTNFTDAKEPNYLFLLSSMWHLYLGTQTVFIIQPWVSFPLFIFSSAGWWPSTTSSYGVLLHAPTSSFRICRSRVYLIQNNSLQPAQHIYLTSPGTIIVMVRLEALPSCWDISISEKSWTLQRPQPVSLFPARLLWEATQILLLCSSKTTAQFQI